MTPAPWPADAPALAHAGGWDELLFVLLPLLLFLLFRWLGTRRERREAEADRRG